MRKSRFFSKSFFSEFFCLLRYDFFGFFFAKVAQNNVLNPSKTTKFSLASVFIGFLGAPTSI